MFFNFGVENAHFLVFLPCLPLKFQLSAQIVVKNAPFKNWKNSSMFLSFLPIYIYQNHF